MVLVGNAHPTYISKIKKNKNRAVTNRPRNDKYPVHDGYLVDEKSNY
jgi:hypothetical protein